ncbi:hypothetical protein BS47DRAFT_1388128 [Hydnum rufescens UP504]|uniref:Uncharacterized protein n=1 Tax=Hydnum rufescens UP504 TaxID=1448309 RepID=A0A9P6B877_9AGAM|nr:hypothetical protein BS47DRAFT_1388128 [Hydnum rufescens UP504]
MHENPPNKNTANFQDEKEISSRNDDSPQRRPATRPNDPPTVNRRASLPPMATNEPAEPPIKQRKAPHTP